MEKLYKIKEALWSELDKSETAKSGELKGGELEAIHKLTDAIKNIDKGIFPKAFCKIIPDILGGDPTG